MSLIYPAHEFRLASETIDIAAKPSTALFTGMLAAAQRGHPIRRALEIGRIRQLIACCAWTDAALALLALEQPRWQVRRLAYDDGEWHCALTKNREMPDWLDGDVETHHADMALAILDAILRARDERAAPPAIAVGPDTPDASWEPALCDNFA